MKPLFLQQIYWNWHYTPERANYEGKTKVAEKTLRLHCLLETEHAQHDTKLQKQKNTHCSMKYVTKSAKKKLIN